MADRPWWLRVSGYPGDRRRAIDPNRLRLLGFRSLPTRQADFLTSPDGVLHIVQVRARGTLDIRGRGLEPPLVALSWLVHLILFRGQWLLEVKFGHYGAYVMPERFRSELEALSAMAPVEAAICAGEWTPQGWRYRSWRTSQ